AVRHEQSRLARVHQPHEPLQAAGRGPPPRPRRRRWPPAMTFRPMVVFPSRFRFSRQGQPRLPGRAETMRKLTVALLSVAFLGLPGLRGVAAAQTPVTRIVYDQCRGGSGDVFCSIGMAVDGSDTLVANGA